MDETKIVDAPNESWVSVKLKDDKEVFFMPKKDPVQKKDPDGKIWKLREGVVGYPTEVHGSPALPKFATKGVVGSKLGGERVASNDPMFAQAIIGSTKTESEKVSTGQAVPLTEIAGGAKSSNEGIGLPSIIVGIGIFAAFVVFALRGK